MPVVLIAPSMSEPSLLRQWITRAKAGDAAAFEHLLALHSRMVLRTAQRLLLNNADAEDAAQDVFLRLHGSLSKFKDDRALVPWLYRITVNICHDMRRRRKEAVALEDTDEFASAAASAEQMLSDQQRRELMRRAISRLGERERDALVLRDLEGLTTLKWPPSWERRRQPCDHKSRLRAERSGSI